MTDKFQELIKSIQNDLVVPDNFNKIDFLAKCAKYKIETRSKLYNNQFDNYITQLEHNELSRNDLNRYISSLKRISRCVTDSYSELIKMINDCEKNIFNKKT